MTQTSTVTPIGTRLPLETAPHRAHEVVSALGALNLASDRLRSELARRLQLSAVDLRALLVIAAEADGITPKDLAGRIDLTSGSVTTLLDRLQTKGFVERVAHPQDRRSLLVRLTPAGTHAHGWVVEHYDAAVAGALDALPETDTTAVATFLRAADTALDASTSALQSADAPRV